MHCYDIKTEYSEKEKIVERMRTIIAPDLKGAADWCNTHIPLEDEKIIYINKVRDICGYAERNPEEKDIHHLNE